MTSGDLSEAGHPPTGLQAGSIGRVATPWKLWCFSLKNFGDALTPYIFEHYRVPFELVEDFGAANLLGIGSNLDRVPVTGQPMVVWSSGYMYDKARPMQYSDSVRILGVRGRRTRDCISGLADRHVVLGDGGLLVRKIFPFSACKKRFNIGIIPHMSDKSSAAVNRMAAIPGAKIIDVFSPIDEVLFQIASSNLIISSSLHGLIVADAFNVPNAFGQFADGRELEGGGFKYGDYGSPLERPVMPIILSSNVDPQEVCSHIKRSWQPSPHIDHLVEELEMSVAVLRAAASGLCTI